MISFVGPSLSPRGEKNPKSRPLSLVSHHTTKRTSFFVFFCIFCFVLFFTSCLLNLQGISGKNGPLRRNSIATAPATDTIGPTTDDFKPMNAFKSTNNFVNSATLPLRRHSTSCSHSPVCA